jgi:hypothetical protein
VASIFVQIASYRDFELGKTILNAVETKSGDHSIHFGVFNCYYKENEVFIPDVPNLSIIEKEAPDGIGVGRARNLANSLYNGEDYYLQIDAHTRFRPNWDRFYVDEVKRLQWCGVEKPLFTTYPGTYRYDENLKEVIDWGESVTIVSFKETPEEFTANLIPGQRAVPTEGLAINRSVSAGSIFTVGSFGQMDFNDKIAFWGEEIFVAAKAFTSGFDLLIPSSQQLFHLYYDHGNRAQRSGPRRHIWKDFPEEWEVMDRESKKEIQDIFSTGRIGRDAMGAVRSLESFGKYAGLDFKTREVLT